TFITSGPNDKAYPGVGANAGRVVVGYYTRDYSPVPTSTDHTCQRALLDTNDPGYPARSEEHTSELQSRGQLVCRLLLEKKTKRRPADGAERVCANYSSTRQRR